RCEGIGAKMEAAYNRQNDRLVDRMPEVERMILWRSIDDHWTSHMDKMDQLRQGIDLRSYGQQKRLREYQNEGHQVCGIMMQSSEEGVSKYILRSVIKGE
ncbi:preprotein translocase subunit SecA, partial [Staphylococcus pseudintermedius]